MKKRLSSIAAQLTLSLTLLISLSANILADTPPTGGSGFGPVAQCNGGPGLDIGLGCIPSTPTGIANAIANLVLGVGGGLAILLIIIAGFKIAASHGDPDTLQDGRSMLTAAIIGLVFMLLATVILGILGVDILGIKFLHFSSGGLTVTNN